VAKLLAALPFNIAIALSFVLTIYGMVRAWPGLAWPAGGNACMQRTPGARAVASKTAGWRRWRSKLPARSSSS
jgi:hypothetical protein